MRVYRMVHSHESILINWWAVLQSFGHTPCRRLVASLLTNCSDASVILCICTRDNCVLIEAQMHTAATALYVRVDEAWRTNKLKTFQSLGCTTSGVERIRCPLATKQPLMLIYMLGHNERCVAPFCAKRESIMKPLCLSGSLATFEQYIVVHKTAA